MKPLLWAKRSIAALLCFGVLLSAPGAALAGTAAEGSALPESTPPASAEGDFVMPETTPAPTETPAASPDLTATPAPTEAPAPTSAPTPTPTPTPTGTPAPTETPTPAATPDPAEDLLAGEVLTFVDLQWKTDPLAGVEAVFTTAAGDREPLTMSGGERGLYTVTVPAGGCEQVAFYPAGGAQTADPLGGVWQLDGSAAPGAEAVTFSAGSLSAFYYDSGDNPSYWGPAPDYDPAVYSISLLADGLDARAAGDAGEPQPDEQVYFVDLHGLKGDDPDPIVTVEARFIKLPHDAANDPAWEHQYLPRTMYEVRDGVYVTAFPNEITTTGNTGYYGGFLYQEIAFDLTRQSGASDKFNRHYNFRGQKSSGDISGTWGRPGWFSYESGRMDAYYYNTSVEDSYWNAHPSNADEGIQNQLLYFDTKDYGDTPEQTIADLYLRWDGMPTEYRGYKYDPDKGFLIKTKTQTKGIFYFQMPADREGLTENTVFTLTYEITAGAHAGPHTFLFTFVPRSGCNAIKMDNLWEDAGEVWTTYQAAAPEETRSVYFNNAVTAFGKVQVVFGKKENGKIEWMNGAAVLGAEWAEKYRANNNVDESTYRGWGKGWLNMSQMDGNQIGEHTIPANVWGFTDVPAGYTHVMFRGALDANADDNNKKLYPEDKGCFWFSPWLEINATYTNPCFFAYRYLDANTAGSAAKEDVQLGNHSYLYGKWGSALEIYSLGDSSAEVPEGEGFQNQDGVYYATTTYYDYYSHWEQSGQPITKTTYQDAENLVAKPPENNLWVSQGVLFNIAVSKYFEEAGVSANDIKPLYFGSGSPMDVDKIISWKNLLTDPSITRGYHNYGKQYNLQALFNYDQTANKWKDHFTGPTTDLLDANLNSAGNATKNGVEIPYFNESFLRGDNDLDLVLGNVYKNVQFPFHQLNNPYDPYDGYWQFDSEKDTLRLTRDPDQSYYLEEKETPVQVNNGGLKSSYLPFNDADDNPNGDMTKINYMFGQRLDLTFTVPEGGQVNMAAPGKTAKMKDVTFEFQGDDDCWIFIDGQMVLDMGGVHDAVRGTINFATNTWSIYRNDGSGNFTLDTSIQNNNVQNNFRLSTTEDGTHTLTVLYFERGLYESNLKLTFNFPQQNTLRVTKEVDTSGVNELFADAMENLGSFEIELQTMATSGIPLDVKNSAGYVETQSLNLYTPTDGTGGTVKPPNQEGGSAEVKTDDNGTSYLEVTQPTGWETDPPPDATADNSGPWLTLHPPDGAPSINLSPTSGEKYAFLELELYNATQDNRGGDLYIQMEDAGHRTVTGTARTLGYMEEANLFLPNARSLVRISLDALVGNTKFDLSQVTAVRIALKNGTGDGENKGHYRLYSAKFGTEWNVQLSTGFSVGDDQISDYGSLSPDGQSGTYRGTYQPANGAWYTRQTRDEGGSVSESVASVVQGGQFSLADDQTAVFTDKFRVGSYIRLQEIVDRKLFKTTWSIRENGEPVSFHSLLPDRPDVEKVTNPPDWGFTRGETPLENQEGTAPDDGRTEVVDSGNFEKYDADADGDPITENGGFVYRSYLYPDNNENLPIDLEVVFHNTMRTGSFTIVKQLDNSMGVPQANGGLRWPVGTYTFDVYYTNIAGRALEQYLPAQTSVEGVGDHYVHQVVTITTGENGRGTYPITGVPAGTEYIIRERPSNGATLVKLEATQGQGENALPLADAVKDVKENGGEYDYSNAYIQYTTTEVTEENPEPTYTFTNKNEPFYMEVQKEWVGEPPDDVKEIEIQVMRRKAGSDGVWDDVTKDYFGDKTETIVLSNANNWTNKSTATVYPTAGENGDNKTILYEYKIVEIGVVQDELAGYRVEYTEAEGKPAEGETRVITYKAINSPTGLTLQKTWLDNQNREGNRPDAVRVKLQRSSDYPDNPAKANWQTIGENGEPDTDATITLEKPNWNRTLEGLPASDGKNSPYYYRLQEVQVQEGGSWVDLASQEEYEPQYSEPVTLDQAATITVQNALRTVELKIIKKDATNSNLLAGAEFRLERLKQQNGEWVVDKNWRPNADDGPDAANVHYLTWKTDGKGELSFKKLSPGTYRLTETQAPGGYAASFTPVDVTLGADKLGKTETIEITNSTPQTFTFTKVAAEDNTKTLQGAVFALYPLVCGDKNHTHTDLLDPENPGACWGKGIPAESDEKGKVEFTKLPAGFYRLVETRAPDGYALPTGQWQVELKADGTADIKAIGNPPAFSETNGSYRLFNRKPMAMPGSGGRGVPRAAALGTALMGAGLLTAGAQLRRRKRRKNHPARPDP